MKIFFFAFIMALMGALIKADSSEEELRRFGRNYRPYPIQQSGYIPNYPYSPPY
ncbi:hypothetical protein CapIbe_005749, partial [Capra ibex]